MPANYGPLDKVLVTVTRNRPGVPTLPDITSLDVVIKGCVKRECSLLPTDGEKVWDGISPLGLISEKILFLMILKYKRKTQRLHKIL